MKGLCVAGCRCWLCRGCAICGRNHPAYEHTKETKKMKNWADYEKARDGWKTAVERSEEARQRVVSLDAELTRARHDYGAALEGRQKAEVELDNTVKSFGAP